MAADNEINSTYFSSTCHPQRFQQFGKSRFCIPRRSEPCNIFQSNRSTGSVLFLWVSRYQIWKDDSWMVQVLTFLWQYLNVMHILAFDEKSRRLQWKRENETGLETELYTTTSYFFMAQSSFHHSHKATFNSYLSSLVQALHDHQVYLVRRRSPTKHLPDPNSQRIPKTGLNSCLCCLLYSPTSGIRKEIEFIHSYISHVDAAEGRAGKARTRRRVKRFPTDLVFLKECAPKMLAAVQWTSDCHIPAGGHQKELEASQVCV